MAISPDTSVGLPSVLPSSDLLPGLSGTVGLFVPSTGKDGTIVDDSEVNDRLRSAQLLLSNIFGGSTTLDVVSIPGRGSWRDDSGVLIEERIWLVFSLSPRLSAGDWDMLVNAAEQLGRMWSQSAVGLIGPSGYVEIDVR